jgi:hypothetical protein
MAPAWSQLAPRCEPFPLDSSIVCTAPLTNEDDRQGISHFFGRNKRETRSIPDGIYPLLCRKHYQERQYRLADQPGQLAGLQCDAILVSLTRMSKLTWTDENGLVWPFWCGFELQTCKPPEGSSAVAVDGANAFSDPDSNPFNTNSKPFAATNPFSDINPSYNINTPAATSPLPKTTTTGPTGTGTALSRADKYFIPTWLISLCSRTATGQTHVPIGDRDGMRLSFHQLGQLVMSIKTYCLQNNVRLPNVEALPITVGMVDEKEVEMSKANVRSIKRELNIAIGELRKAEARVELRAMGVGDEEGDTNTDIYDESENEDDGASDGSVRRKAPAKADVKGNGKAEDTDDDDDDDDDDEADDDADDDTTGDPVLDALRARVERIKTRLTQAEARLDAARQAAALTAHLVPGRRTGVRTPGAVDGGAADDDNDDGDDPGEGLSGARGVRSRAAPGGRIIRKVGGRGSGVAGRSRAAGGGRVVPRSTMGGVRTAAAGSTPGQAASPAARVTTRASTRTAADAEGATSPETGSIAGTKRAATEEMFTGVVVKKGRMRKD